MYFLLKVGIFHCYVSLPEGIKCHLSVSCPPGHQAMSPFQFLELWRWIPLRDPFSSSQKSVNFWGPSKDPKVSQGITIFSRECVALTSQRPQVLKGFLPKLVGGWTNPFKKYDRQIGNLPQFSGWKFKKYWRNHPPNVKVQGITWYNWTTMGFRATNPLGCPVGT